MREYEPCPTVRDENAARLFLAHDDWTSHCLRHHLTAEPQRLSGPYVDAYKIECRCHDRVLDGLRDGRLRVTGTSAKTGKRQILSESWFDLPGAELNLADGTIRIPDLAQIFHRSRLNVVHEKSERSDPLPAPKPAPSSEINSAAATTQTPEAFVAEYIGKRLAAGNNYSGRGAQFERDARGLKGKAGFGGTTLNNLVAKERTKRGHLPNRGGTGSKG